MKKKIIHLFLALIAAAFASGLFAACAAGPTSAEKEELSKEAEAIDEIAGSVNPEDFSPSELEEIETQE